MLTLLTVYVIGIFASFLILGYLSASFALAQRSTHSQGMILFTGDAAGKQFMLTLIWPMIVSYMLAYRGLLYYIIFLHNREIKRQAKVEEPAIDIVEEDPTPVTPPPFTKGLN